MKKQIVVGILFSLISSIASAHPDHGLFSAYAGFMHPLTGWDHLLVMLAIGVWASKLGGKACWQLPLTFMSMMSLGAMFGLAGLTFSGVETAIAASVMALGALLMMSLPINVNVRLGIVAIFAVFHGMAHGVELYSQQSYMALGGMLFATALLHGAGLLLGSHRDQLAKWLHTGLAWLMLFTGSYLLLS
ncbi:MAG TPA: HupE/UreJ family protein [Methylotenera sp.]|nr:HupE/UreJ family protein [Methylotenera sp.]